MDVLLAERTRLTQGRADVLGTIDAVIVAESFYVSVMKELVVAFGAALVVGNVLAMVRKRPADATDTVTETKSEGKTDAAAAGSTLVRAPLWRSLLFVALGLVMVVWGLASILR